MSRSQPPGLADDGGRRASLYRAAIQQFEDLITAASSTSPAASPLPLYYALNQAGRAVLAVRETNDDVVFALSEVHGLTIHRQDVLDSPDDLLAVPVRPKSPDSSHCRRVAEATSSPCLTEGGGVPLGAVLAALPEVTDGWRDDRWHTAVAFHPLMDLTSPQRPSLLPGLAGVMDAQSFVNGRMRVALATDAVKSQEDLAAFLPAYPSLAGLAASLPLANARNEPGRIERMTPSGLGFELHLNVPRSDGITLVRETTKRPSTRLRRSTAGSVVGGSGRPSRHRTPRRAPSSLGGSRSMPSRCSLATTPSRGQPPYR
jgi:hypothetical protein